MNFQDFIPPILVRSLKKHFISRTEVPSPRFFSTYVEARNACYGSGYQDADIVETIFAKTMRIKDQMLSGKFPISESAAQSLLAVLFSLQHHGAKKQIKVVDFGGACGTHYFQIRPFLLPDVQLDWGVVETLAMVERAKALETSELHFFASILEAKETLQSVDLLHSSGALQYVPDPQATIQEFMGCQSAFLFLDRLALSASELFIAVQESFLSANGPGALPQGLPDKLCCYPITYFPKQHLEEMLAPSYQTIIEFADTKAVIIGKEIFANACIFAERF